MIRLSTRTTTTKKKKKKQIKVILYSSKWMAEKSAEPKRFLEMNYVKNRGTIIIIIINRLLSFRTKGCRRSGGTNHNRLWERNNPECLAACNKWKLWKIILDRIFLYEVTLQFDLFFLLCPVSVCLCVCRCR